MKVQREVLAKFASKKWRMDNIYKVRNKQGTVVRFKRNQAQIKLANISHPRKITTKVRQLGISTDAVIDALDTCLFKAGTQAGIQSFGLVESAKLRAKAQLAWRRLPKKVKNMLGVKLIADNSNGMEFSNGSVLRIGNFRGDTLTKFHVSELAKISKDNPLKAKEIQTGAFEAVAIGNKITVESTADGAIGLHAEMWFEAVEKLNSGDALSPLDFYPIFLGFLDVEEYELDILTRPNTRAKKWFSTIANDYKCKVSVTCCNNILTTPFCPNCKAEAPFIPTEVPNRPKHDIVMTIPKMNWVIGKLHNLGEAFNSEYPIIADIAFHTPTEGAYFSYEYEDILKEDRIKPDLYNPELPVDVAWDLGMSDEMVLTFSQTDHEEGIPRLINEVHGQNKGIPYFVELLNGLAEKLGYEYGDMYVPFDISVSDMSMSVVKTRERVLRDLGVTNIKKVDKIGFADSIQICRLMLAVCEIDKDNCSNIVKTLSSYRKKYDKKLGVFIHTKDVHDIWSNYGASLRYMAQGLGYKIKEAYQEEDNLYGEEQEYEEFTLMGL